MRPGGPARGLPGALPAPALRRPGAPRRRRPRARAGAQADHRRRADGRARRLGPGRDPQPDEPTSRGSSAWPISSSPTTFRWCAMSRQAGDHVSRPHRRAGRLRAIFERRRPSLHAGPARPRRAQARPGQPARRWSRSGRGAEPGAPAPGCEFHTRCPFAQDKCRAVAPDYKEVAPGRFASCHFPFPDPADAKAVGPGAMPRHGAMTTGGPRRSGLGWNEGASGSATAPTRSGPGYDT